MFRPFLVVTKWPRLDQQWGQEKASFGRSKVLGVTGRNR